MIDKEKYPEFTCSICGVKARATYMEPDRSRMIENKMCFKCDFWQAYLKMRERNNPNAVVVDGVHYYIERGNTFDKGFGGAEVRIKFHDSREVTTTNLWYQGAIPDHFRDRLTDNAVFLQKGKR